MKYLIAIMLLTISLNAMADDYSQGVINSEQTYELGQIDQHLHELAVQEAHPGEHCEGYYCFG